MVDPVLSPIEWLLECDEPWTRYQVRLDLLGQTEHDTDVRAERTDLLAHPWVKSLIARASTWPDVALRRHNDAGHPLTALGVLVDFGLQAGDPDMDAVLDAVLAHQSPDGAFLSLLNIPESFGGTGSDQWAWMLCDAPTLLYVLLAAGLGGDERVQSAVQHLLTMYRESGYPCSVSVDLGRFRGPGRKSDPCPVANLYALKAMSLAPEVSESTAARIAGQAILRCWEQRAILKPYLFGMGTDFRKLKYPFVWYDILHVVEVLSRFPLFHQDYRFREMLDIVMVQANPEGRYTAGSMYQPWKGWSFANKKQPSPWLTFLVMRIQKRVSLLCK